MYECDFLALEEFDALFKLVRVLCVHHKNIHTQFSASKGIALNSFLADQNMNQTLDKAGVL